MNSLKNNVVNFVSEKEYMLLEAIVNGQRVREYLIEKKGEVFHVHRALDPGERTYYSSKQVLLFEGYFYLSALYTLSSLDEVVAKIQALWSDNAKVIATKKEVHPI